MAGGNHNTLRLAVCCRNPKKVRYNFIVDFEVQTTDEGLAFVVRKIVYMGKLFSKQEYRLDELKELAREEGKRNVDLYRNMDHPVLIALDFSKKKGRGNKIVRIKLKPMVYEYSDGLLGKVEEVKELSALPSEVEGFGMEEFITLYIDEEDKNPKGVFKLLLEGVLNTTRPEEDRIKTIEEFTGPLGKGDIKMLEDVWGTAGYFEKRGEDRGEKRGIENTVKKTVEILKELGMSDEEIQQRLKEKGLVTE